MAYKETKSFAPSTKGEHFRALVAEYLDTGGKQPVDPVLVAEWAIQKGKLDPPRVDPKRVLAKEISRALRQELHKDAKNRLVRTNHAIRRTQVSDDGAKVQHYLWSSMEKASQEHMEEAFGDRRHQILGDCKQLKTDTDSFNDFHAKRPVPFSANFTEDLEELELSTEYEEPKEEDSEDERDESF